MELLDLKNLRVIETEKVFTYRLQVDAGELLNMPLSKAYDKIQELLKIGFKNKNLFIYITFKNLVSETEEARIDDFEALCGMMVTGILKRNVLDEEKTAEEKGKIMNTLPHGHGWTLPKFLSDRINCAYMTLRKCGDYNFANKSLAVRIETDDMQLLYNFIGEKQEPLESEA